MRRLIALLVVALLAATLYGLHQQQFGDRGERAEGLQLLVHQ